MKLFCLTNYKTPEGLFYIEIKINNSPKIYTYVLNSEFYKRKFEQFYKRMITHGRALKILQEGNINKKREYA